MLEPRTDNSRFSIWCSVIAGCFVDEDSESAIKAGVKFFEPSSRQFGENLRNAEGITITTLAVATDREHLPQQLADRVTGNRLTMARTAVADGKISKAVDKGTNKRPKLRLHTQWNDHLIEMSHFVDISVIYVSLTSHQGRVHDRAKLWLDVLKPTQIRTWLRSSVAEQFLKNAIESTRRSTFSEAGAQILSKLGERAGIADADEVSGQDEPASYAYFRMLRNHVLANIDPPPALQNPDSGSEELDDLKFTNAPDIDEQNAKHEGIALLPVLANVLVSDGIGIGRAAVAANSVDGDIYIRENADGVLTCTSMGHTQSIPASTYFRVGAKYAQEACSPEASSSLSEMRTHVGAFVQVAWRNVPRLDAPVANEIRRHGLACRVHAPAPYDSFPWEILPCRYQLRDQFAFYKGTCIVRAVGNLVETQPAELASPAVLIVFAAQEFASLNDCDVVAEGLRKEGWAVTVETVTKWDDFKHLRELNNVQVLWIIAKGNSAALKLDREVTQEELTNRLTDLFRLRLCVLQFDGSGDAPHGSFAAGSIARAVLEAPTEVVGPLAVLAWSGVVRTAHLHDFMVPFWRALAKTGHLADAFITGQKEMFSNTLDWSQVRLFARIENLQLFQPRSVSAVPPALQLSDDSAESLNQWRRWNHQPYSQRELSDFVGRKQEIEILDQWLLKPDSEYGKYSTFCIYQVGGGGKSFLTWYWLSHLYGEAPQDQSDGGRLESLKARGFSGTMWVSFYQPGYTMASFRSHLADFLGVVPGSDDVLIAALNAKPVLLILDGLEREMGAYANMGLQDRSNTTSLNELDIENLTETDKLKRSQRRLRNPKDGLFLRRLAESKAKLLITSRNRPANLEDSADEDASVFAPLDSVLMYPLGDSANGMLPADALALWQKNIGTKDSSNALKEFLELVGFHPQVIKACAAAATRMGCTKFDAWLKLMGDDAQLAVLASVESESKRSTRAMRRYDWLRLATRSLAANPLFSKIMAKIIESSESSTFDVLAGQLPDIPREQLFKTLRDQLEPSGLLGLVQEDNGYRIDVHPVMRNVVVKFWLTSADGETRRIDDVANRIQERLDRDDYDGAYEVFERQVTRHATSAAFDPEFHLQLAKKLVGGQAAIDANICPPYRSRYLLAEALRTLGQLHTERNESAEAQRFSRRAAALHALGNNVERLGLTYQAEGWREFYEGDVVAAEQNVLWLYHKHVEAGQTDEAAHKRLWLALFAALRGSKHAEAMLESEFKRVLNGTVEIDRRYWLQTIAEGFVYLRRYEVAMRVMKEVGLSRSENPHLLQIAWEQCTIGMILAAKGSLLAIDRLSIANSLGVGQQYPILAQFGEAQLLATAARALSRASSKRRAALSLEFRTLMRTTWRSLQEHETKYMIPNVDGTIAYAEYLNSIGRPSRAIELLNSAENMLRGSDVPYSKGLAEHARVAKMLNVPAIACEYPKSKTLDEALADALGIPTMQSTSKALPRDDARALFTQETDTIHVPSPTAAGHLVLRRGESSPALDRLEQELADLARQILRPSQQVTLDWWSSYAALNSTRNQWRLAKTLAEHSVSIGQLLAVLDEHAGVTSVDVIVQLAGAIH